MNRLTLGQLILFSQNIRGDCLKIFSRKDFSLRFISWLELKDCTLSVLGRLNVSC